MESRVADRRCGTRAWNLFVRTRRGWGGQGFWPIRRRSRPAWGGRRSACGFRSVSLRLRVRSLDASVCCGSAMALESRAESELHAVGDVRAVDFSEKLKGRKVIGFEIEDL